MLFVTTIQGIVDVIAYHVANLLRAIGLFEQVAAQGSGYSIRNVLVLRDGQHLLVSEATERDAILTAMPPSACLCGSSSSHCAAAKPLGEPLTDAGLANGWLCLDQLHAHWLY
jgi:hypothetical protein